MATPKEIAIAAAKEAAKQKIANKIADLKDKGIADAARNVYEPPAGQEGFSFDIMTYQSGWLSTGKSLPAGIQQITQPSVLGFRVGCRDLEKVLSNINDQQLEDDTSEQAVSFTTPEIIDRQLTGFPANLDATISTSFKPKIPSHDPDTGTTINTEEPPEPSEDAINALDSQTQQPVVPNLLDFKDSPFLGLGRTATIIDRVDYAVPIGNIERDYGIENSLVADHIKNFNGSFYVLDTDSSLRFYKDLSIPGLTSKRRRYISKLDTLNQIGNKATLERASLETYSFRFDKDLKVKKSQDKSRFKNSFILGQSFTGSIINQNKDKFKFEKLINENVDLRDNTFSLQMPFENSEMLNTLNLIGTSIIDIKENYNFYIKEYEKIATKSYSNSQENVLPNLYILNAILEEKTEEKDFLASLAKLDGLIESGKDFLLNKSEKIIFGIKDSIGEYFDLFGLNYENLLVNKRSLHNSYKNKLSNIIFLSDATSNLSEINKKKYMFPMSVELSIPADKTTTITRTLMDSDLMDSFLLKLYDLYKNNKFVAKESVMVEQLFTQKINPGNQRSEIVQTFSSKRKSINSVNISDLLEEIKQNPIDLNKSNYTIIGDTTKYMRTNTNSMSFVNGLRNIIFNSKLNTFVKNNYRTYKDVLDGKKCYNETVAYRVSKYEKDSNIPIQNYWLANNPDLDFLNIVDTQVKYEKEYTYKIFAYQFILGNKIKQKINNSGTSDDNFKIDVENLPEANLIEVELISTIKRVADTPPLSPEILFVPYKGVDNKIGLFLNGRTGEEKLETINILETDQAVTSLYKKNLNNTVLYKSDDISKRFEIMKLEKKPNSYQDFSKGFIKTVSTDIDPATIQSASAAAFIDTIEPNKKYYYCFRAIDIHEKISNPTQIFEVEMVNEKGMVFPIVKNYEFESPAYTGTKEIRRFIKIKPASQHTFLNRETSQIENDTTAEQSLRKIKIGLSDVAVPWGKTFKMVLTSKQTGKKCEFKFKFNYKTE
jgi:hypothetical protein